LVREGLESSAEVLYRNTKGLGMLRELVPYGLTLQMVAEHPERLEHVMRRMQHWMNLVDVAHLQLMERQDAYDRMQLDIRQETWFCQAAERYVPPAA